MWLAVVGCEVTHVMSCYIFFDVVVVIQAM